MNLAEKIKTEMAFYRPLRPEDSARVHSAHNIVAQNTDLDKRVSNALEAISSDEHFKDCTLEFYLKEDNYLRKKKVIGTDKAHSKNLPKIIRRDDPIYGRLNKKGITDDHFPFRNKFVQEAGIEYSLVSPTNSRGILILSRKKKPFGKYEKQLLKAYSHSTLNFTIENATKYAQTKIEATTDPLTGVYNRRGLSERLKEDYVREARRSEHGVSFLLMDIDHFKKFNDRHGHDKGDKILKSVGKILSESTRRIDTVARYGGEEFAIVFPNTSKHYARFVAEKLKRAIHKETGITLSIGIASTQDAKEGYARLIKKADKALYEAKKTRDCIICA